MPDLFSDVDPPLSARDQHQWDLYQQVSAMRDHTCPEWEQFVELVREYIHEQERAKTGVPHGHKRAAAALRPLSLILGEWEEQKKPVPALNFLQPAPVRS
jgi:hypothetical protein